MRQTAIYLSSSSTAGDLETRVESLTTTNALMKADLERSEKLLERTREENKQLLDQIEHDRQLSKKEEVRRLCLIWGMPYM